MRVHICVSAFELEWLFALCDASNNANFSVQCLSTRQAHYSNLSPTRRWIVSENGEGGKVGWRTVAAGDIHQELHILFLHATQNDTQRHV
jgi:hypothetical protein